MTAFIRTLCAIALCVSAAWSADPTLLPGVIYEVVSLQGRPITAADDLQTPNLMIDPKDGGVSGCSGVNRFGGSCTWSGATVRFGQLFSTMMAASEPAMHVEREFLAMLAGPLHLTAQGDQLLLTGDTGVIVLRASTQPAATAK